jgi:signal transduction histidine kinase
MRERVEEIGSTLETWSRPGAGTEVEIQIRVTRMRNRALEGSAEFSRRVSGS